MRPFVALIAVALCAFIFLPSHGWTQPSREDGLGSNYPAPSNLEQAQRLATSLARENKAMESLRISEYTKARSLAEGMTARLADGSQIEVPADALNKINEMSDLLNALKKRRQEAYERGNMKLAAELDKQIKERDAEMAAHVDWLRKEYPIFAAVRFPGPWGLSQIPLKEDEWVLNYCVTDSGMVTYLIRGNSLVKTLFKPIPRRELSDLVHRFTIWNIDRGNIKEMLQGFDCALGKKLADILVSDILADLPESAPLIIVPDDCLTALPFETLVLNEGGKVEAVNEIPTVSGAQFFGDRHPISYYQSLTVLALTRMRGTAHKPGDRILVMADPIFSANDDRYRRERIDTDRHHIMQKVPVELMSGREQQSFVFPRLPVTGTLADGLKQLDPGRTDVYVGAEATKNNILGRSLTQYGTMVIATHGYSGTDLPGIREPVLILSQVDLPKGQDGYLRMSEVMGLKLNADLVALISGGSGTGQFIPGEGVMSMGRAFQCAGVRSVLVSIGPTTEMAAVKLADHFFKEVSEGKTKREALKLAKGQIRKDGYDHPFFWAPFILVGEAQ